MFKPVMKSIYVLVPAAALLYGVMLACRARQGDAGSSGLTVWRKSITVGADTPMKADMLMTQRRHGKTITTQAHIVQGPRGRYRMEYILPEEAKGRIVFSDGQSNWQFEPQQNVLAKTSMVAMNEQRDRDAEQLIESNYVISLVSEKASAAGRTAYLLDLKPRQPGKSSQRRWIDRRTFKTLRIETHYTDGILARMVAYSGITLPAAVSEADFTTMSGHAAHTVSAGASTFYLPTHTIPPAYANLKLNARAALGFNLIEISTSEIDGEKATQLLYSDGIESVSVFAQSGAAGISSIPANWTRVPIGTKTAFQNIDGHLDALTWIEDGYRYTAVSHLTPEALKTFVGSAGR